MEIHPTEISQEENDYDDQMVLRDLTSTIAWKIREGAQKTESFSSSACINRVPKELCKLKESAYTPRLVAIGPLHRNDEHRQTPMQHVKMSYAENLLGRLTVGMKGLELAEKENAVLQECVGEMRKSLDDAKKCYAEGVNAG
ncbi:hypothetical protein RHGRI_038905 [Rhododendron griersonianum]|uniref:Uncharacterized protein n=1 Tax=Rhododendron griersonianum TaxID=479676 RepID=A0AAV6HLW5_9ERIC|nr:hypothetical protein RHGRI_038905 [Rhododendron griersonianum]